ncbi:hypothetical protein J2W22_002972 [Sphingomonas kyeonggiensis]|uniref:hypothetical protein n=1 Tax=Sphingomonas kyeonggiensis TaxID=1268553 RepID=UPI00278B5CCB|nr:hypothetical protein [Sphingomonas kyeonggiensis]MDQ0250908.1 hypothetical protein [Sphingomonas kyeonggiensis]
MILTMMALLLAVQQQREPDIARLEMLSTADRFDPITDAELVAVVKAPFDPKSEVRTWKLAVGLHRGVPVVATYTCSDLCPDNTKRIIRYNVTAGAACDRVGGVSKDIVVPKGIGVGPRRYCLPAVTAPFQN